MVFVIVHLQIHDPALRHLPNLHAEDLIQQIFQRPVLGQRIMIGQIDPKYINVRITYGTVKRQFDSVFLGIPQYLMQPCHIYRAPVRMSRREQIGIDDPVVIRDQFRISVGKNDFLCVHAQKFPCLGIRILRDPVRKQHDAGSVLRQFQQHLFCLVFIRIGKAV